MPADYLPVLLALGLALLVGAAMLGLGALLSRHKGGGRIKLTTYESGLPLLDRSHKRLSIVFFLVALDFVVFDVEAAFLYPWVLVLREGGWPLFWPVMGFIAMILIGYVYVWRRGGLEVTVRQPRPPLVPGAPS